MNIHSGVHHVDETSIDHVAAIFPQLLLSLPFFILFIMYISAVIFTNRRYKPWPLYRTVCWVLGILCALLAVVGPLANRALVDFTAHMMSHLLLGMLAPLLMAIAAPVTLLLRTLRTSWARGLSRFLKSWLSRIYTHPIVATFLNIGGLWVLYTTDLYSLMHESTLLHVIIHLHVFIAGYLFTVSIIYFDPVFHRKSFLYRATVLIIALAGHGILSKYLYAHPPAGVPPEQAELGSMIMYYGGDLIDAIIIFLLCLQWFRATKPRAAEPWAAEKQRAFHNQ